MPLQTDILPEIVAGCCGRGSTETASVCEDEEPHVLPAVTLIVPPEALPVVFMVFDEEVPVHPRGNTQV